MEPSGARTRERSFPKTLDAAGLEGGNDRTYRVVSHAEAQAAAEQIIADKGVDGAIEWLAAADDIGSEHTALAYQLLDQLDDDRAVGVAADISRKLTRQGQAVAAAQIVSRLAPARVVVVASRIAEEAGRDLSADDIAKLKELAAKASAAEERADALDERVAEQTRSFEESHRLADERISRLEAELEQAQKDLASARKRLASALIEESKVEPLERKVANLQAQLRRAREEKESRRRARAVRTAVTVRANALTKRFDKLEDEARARIAARVAARQTERSEGVEYRNAGVPLPVADARDMAIIGAAKMARGVVNFAAWSSEMMADFDEEIRPFLSALYLRSMQTLREERAALREERLKRAAVRRIITPDTTTEEIDALLKDAEALAPLMREA
ncbi:MAG TPA: hypothetical protein VEZ40_02785, partial [Pyrinomonadaceae bacterium]|nr:hypothetical protein [Pyrinomonadaceae bacterium]